MVSQYHVFNTLLVIKATKTLFLVLIMTLFLVLIVPFWADKGASLEVEKHTYSSVFENRDSQQIHYSVS